MNNKNTNNAKNNSHKSLDIFRSPKNNEFFSYDTNLKKAELINTYINYIFLIRKNKPLIDKYSSLVPDNNFSINYIAHKLKLRLRNSKYIF